MTEVDDVLRRHRYHPIRVKGVVEETDDTRSLVLDVPDELAEVFRYQPGQFCTFRVRIGTDEHFRCYSMSSAPETDGDLAVTVKRVDGGAVSNWLNDNVSVGDLVEVSRPSGTFRIRDGDGPIIGLCGGSGITPVISIAKSILSTSGRSVRLLYASRNPDSVIFDGTLRDLESRYPGRLTVVRHFDSVSGFPDAGAVVDVAGGDPDADFYVCGPGPFMVLVEQTLLGLGVEPGAILIERFEAGAGPEVPSPSEPPGATVPSTIVLQLKGKRREIDYHPGDTVLETARRANLPAPYSCEAGSCATCMALVLEGSVTMRVNNALTPDEVEEGWILTCQSVPIGPSLRVDYEDV
jgi:3-ketosteroid 9alpha-monooxygenase subunit B